MFGLTKLADKDFVVGFVLPVLIGLCVFAVIFQGEAWSAGLIEATFKQKTLTDLTWLVLSIWAAATLLMSLNESIYRLMEGYYGPFKYLQRLLDIERRRYITESERVNELYRCWHEVKSDKTLKAYIKARREFLSRFPDNVDWLLPTQFGNVIRAFETYPNKLYGADGVPTWNRLIGVVPNSFISVINSARSMVDFFLNTCLIAVFLGFTTIGRILYQLYELRAGEAQAQSIEGNIAIGIAIFAVAFRAYKAAVDHAVAWGDVVKSAFDLYLPALAKQLGFELPSTSDKRRDFWEDFNEMVLIQSPMAVEKWKAAKQSNLEELKSSAEGSEKEGDASEPEASEDEKSEGGGNAEPSSERPANEIEENAEPEGGEPVDERQGDGVIRA